METTIIGYIGFRVWCLGFRFQDLGFRMQGCIGLYRVVRCYTRL